MSKPLEYNCIFIFSDKRLSIIFVIFIFRDYLWQKNFEYIVLFLPAYQKIHVIFERMFGKSNTAGIENENTFILSRNTIFVEYLFFFKLFSCGVYYDPNDYDLFLFKIRDQFDSALVTRNKVTLIFRSSRKTTIQTVKFFKRVLCEKGLNILVKVRGKK